VIYFVGAAAIVMWLFIAVKLRHWAAWMILLATCYDLYATA